jgi:hypothetical protein
MEQLGNSHGGTSVTSHTHGDGQPRTIGRRRLVRSAATVAWAVPAIQVATAVPAFAAASGCSTAAATGNAQWRTGGLNYIDIALNLTNGCNTPVSGLTVTLTFCDLDDITYTGYENLPAGWTQAGRPNQDPQSSQGCYTLTYTSAMTLNGQASTSPLLTVKSKGYNGGTRPEGHITVVVSAGGVTSAPMTIVVPEVS